MSELREGIDRAVETVSEFQRRVGVDFRQRVSDGEGYRDKVSDAVRLAGERLIRISMDLAATVQAQDRRGNRAHLLVEELGEFLVALADGDEVAALDGLADLLYVLLGAAVVFDLPLGAAFVEVHKSNMTKERQPGDPLGDRVRQKGPHYVAPDLARVLKEHRS